MKATENVVDVHRILGDTHGDLADCVMSVKVTPDSEFTMVATSGGPIHFTGKTNWLFNPLGFADNAALTSARLGPLREDGLVALVSTSSSGDVKCWALRAGAAAKCLGAANEGKNELLVAEFTQDATKVATGGSDKVIRLYDVSTGEDEMPLIQKFEEGIDSHGQPTLGHPSRIFAIKHNTPHTFLSAGWESSVLLFDLRAGAAAQRAFAGPRVSGDAVDFTGNIVVAASDRPQEQLEIFDYGSGRRIEGATTMPSRLFGAKLSTFGSKPVVWVCGTENSALYCVDIASRKTVASVSVPESLFSVDVVPDAPLTIVTGGSRNAAYRIKVREEE